MATEGSSSSTSAVDSVEKQEILTKANELLAQGKRNVVCGEVPKAITFFDEAVQILAKEYGDLSRNCADAYFSYGSALLELGRMETNVLGVALEGVDVEAKEDEADSEQFEKPPQEGGEEREKLRSEVYDAMAEGEREEKLNEKESKPEETSETKEKVDANKGKDEEMDTGLDKDEKAETSATDKVKSPEKGKDDAVADKGKSPEKGKNDAVADKGKSPEKSKDDAVADKGKSPEKGKDEMDTAEKENAGDIKAEKDVTSENKDAKAEQSPSKVLSESQQNIQTKDTDMKDDTDKGEDKSETEKNAGKTEVKKTEKSDTEKTESAECVKKESESKATVQNKDGDETVDKAPGKSEEKDDKKDAENEKVKDEKLEGDGKSETDTKQTDATNDTKEKEDGTKDESKEKKENEDDSKDKKKDDAKDESKDKKDDVKDEAKLLNKKELDAKDVSEDEKNKTADKDEGDVEMAEDEGEGDAAETGEETAEEEGKEGEEEEKEGDESQEGETSQDDGEEKEEDIPNFQLAWEYLDLAKVIYLKSDSKEDQMKAAECHIKLGEVSMETEQHNTAAEDLQSALKIQQKHLAPEDRVIAETHYQLGLAYGLGKEFELCIEHYQLAISVIEAKITLLKKFVEDNEVDPDNKENSNTAPATEVEKSKEEIKELEELIPEMKNKIEDTRSEIKDMEKMKEMAKEMLGLSGTSKGFGSPTKKAEPAADSSAKVEETTEKKAMDISSLVRKKRKPEEDAPATATEIKKIKQDGDAQVKVNGDVDVKVNGDAEVKVNGDAKINGTKEVTANGDAEMTDATATASS